MQPNKRLPSSGHSTPSPPPSPLRSPRYRRSKGRFPPAQQNRSFAHRFAWLLLSVLLRRQGIFLFAPLIYISGMLLYMGTVSLKVVPLINHKPAPGSVYKSPEVYAKLKPEMDADNSTADAVSSWIEFKIASALGFVNLKVSEVLLDVSLAVLIHLYLEGVGLNWPLVVPLWEPNDTIVSLHI